jgi:dTDP-N-acetylfucosamine:lipid II N-acetylfucosaminyltransferase
MNYHIMIDDKFLDEFISDVAELELLGDNIFFIRGEKEKAKYVKSEMAIWLNNEEEIINLFKVISVDDKLFVHWYDYSIGKLCLDLKNSIPLYVFFWGGEFYEDPPDYNTKFLFDKKTLRWWNKRHSKHEIQKRSINFFRFLLNHRKRKLDSRNRLEEKRRTIQRINFLVYPPGCDYEINLVKKIFDAPGIEYRAGFYNQNFDLSSTLSKRVKSDNTLKILVGNSSTEANNHLDCFDWLSNLELANVEIICPLSYGDATYRDKIICEGEKYFGKNFKPVVNFLDKTKYIELLNEVDLAVFFHNRSQAFGNIISLITLGKKVFLKSRNPFYKYLNNIGVNVYNANEKPSLIKKNIFASIENKEHIKNHQQLHAHLSDKIRLECLKNLLTKSF